MSLKIHTFFSSSSTHSNKGFLTAFFLLALLPIAGAEANLAGTEEPVLSIESPKPTDMAVEPANTPQASRKETDQKGAEAPEFLILLQNRQAEWTREDQALREIAGEEAETELDKTGYLAWLESVRQGEDPDLRKRVLAHDKTFGDIQQIVRSLTLAAQNTPAVETPPAPEPVQPFAAIEAELIPLIQELGKLRAQRAKHHAESDDNIPQTLLDKIQRIEQEILTLISLNDISIDLTEDVDGDTL